LDKLWQLIVAAETSLGALAHAVGEADQLLLALGRRADEYQFRVCAILPARRIQLAIMLPSQESPRDAAVVNLGAWGS
jgi:hypothetical protein